MLHLSFRAKIKYAIKSHVNLDDIFEELGHKD